MKTLVLSTLFIALISAAATAQITYQKQFSAPGSDKTAQSVYAEKYDTCVLLVTNKCIIRFNENTGAVYSCKDISITDSNIRINSVYRKDDILYIAATAYLTQYAGRVLKYNLSTDVIVWQKAFDEYVAPHGITGDGSGNLYLAGTVSDPGGNIDLAVIKMDTNGILTWAKKIGAPLMDEYSSAIAYSDLMGICITGFAGPGAFGWSVTLRLDPAGNIRNTNAIATIIGPRLHGGLMTVINNRLYTVIPTTLGHDAVGPTLIRVLDTSLAPVRSKTINRIDLRNISCNERAVLLSAQAPLMDGVPGFRTVRMDTDLNVTGARYFDKIPAASISTTAACFINSDNSSFHFFSASGSDTVNVIRANADEATFCEDTEFLPGSDVVNYVDTPYLYVSSPLTMGLFNFSAHVSHTEIAVTGKCVPNSIQFPEAEGKLLLHPNPARDEINISLKTGKPYETRITDMLGRAIITSHSKDKMDISQLASGVYTVSVICEHTSYTTRFIKE